MPAPLRPTHLVVNLSQIYRNLEVIRAEDLAAWAGTNPYEVMTNIGARVPRIYMTEVESSVIGPSSSV